MAREIARRAVCQLTGGRSQRKGGGEVQNGALSSSTSTDIEAYAYAYVNSMARRGRGLGLRLDPGAQYLGHAPGLGHAAARRVGFLGVEDLADGPDAGLVQMWAEAVEEGSRPRSIVRVEPEPRVDE